jgi:hypothetical protein
MSKRRQGPTSVKAPLLAALETEYVRSAVQRNPDRMKELLEMIRRLQPDYVPTAEPPAIMQPIEQIALPVNPVRQPYVLTDLLKAANDGEQDIKPPPLQPPPMPTMPPPQPAITGPVSEVSRKQAARARVQNAVNDSNRLLPSEQLNYERALMVKVGKLQAQEDMKLAAAIRNVSVLEHAEHLVTERDARHRRSAHVDAIKHRAFAEIDQARGDEIEVIASAACINIKGDLDASY